MNLQGEDRQKIFSRSGGRPFTGRLRREIPASTTGAAPGILDKMQILLLLGRGRLSGSNLPEQRVCGRYIYLPHYTYCLQHLFVDKEVELRLTEYLGNLSMYTSTG